MSFCDLLYTQSPFYHYNTENWQTFSAYQHISPHHDKGKISGLCGQIQLGHSFPWIQPSLLTVTEVVLISSVLNAFIVQLNVFRTSCLENIQRTVNSTEFNTICHRFANWQLFNPIHSFIVKNPVMKISLVQGTQKCEVVWQEKTVRTFQESGND